MVLKSNVFTKAEKIKINIAEIRYLSFIFRKTMKGTKLNTARNRLPS